MYREELCWSLVRSQLFMITFSDALFTVESSSVGSQASRLLFVRHALGQESTGLPLFENFAKSYECGRDACAPTEAVGGASVTKRYYANN